jgi:hypothetical protein
MNQKASVQTLLAPEAVAAWRGRIVAFVNSAEPGRVSASWGQRPIPLAVLPRLQAALRDHLEALSRGRSVKKSLNMLVGLCRISTPITLSAQLSRDGRGEQRLLALEFDSVLTELFVASGDLATPGYRETVLRCGCELYAGKCRHFFVRTRSKGPGDRPSVLPEHRLLERERRWLNRNKKLRNVLLAEFRENGPAREEARRLKLKRT